MKINRPFRTSILHRALAQPGRHGKPVAAIALFCLLWAPPDSMSAAPGRTPASPTAGMTAKQDPASGQIGISENGKPVLRYNLSLIHI